MSSEIVFLESREIINATI